MHPDAIFALTTKYLADEHTQKILLGQGAYSDGEGRPWILPSVQLAEEIVQGSGHEYLPIAGLKAFRTRALDLVFYGVQALDEDRVRSIPISTRTVLTFQIASCQAPLGSGSLYMAGSALKIISPDLRDVTQHRHGRVTNSNSKQWGYDVIEAPYYKDKRFDFQAYLAALESANPGSVVTFMLVHITLLAVILL